MPRRCETSPLLPALLRGQDGVISRDQALAVGLTRRALDYRLSSGQWAVLLPSVYLSQGGAPSRRQMLIGALLYAGPDAAIDAGDACRFHGITAVAIDDALVHVLVPATAAARSRDFVVVRRTTAPFRHVSTRMVTYVDAATAVIGATRLMRTERQVLAAMSEGLQRRVVTYEQLATAHVQGPPRNARLAELALDRLRSGVLSAPEADFMSLVSTSRLLPRVDYNVWLRLPSGRRLCVDALIQSSAVVHETNGRSAHARADLFDDMQERHCVLTAAGFTVLHNPPRRITLQGHAVIAEVERCHAMYAGRGMPPGVVVLGGVASASIAI